ncbi:MAG: D-2-hydroxyacid dehydrogenase [Deltaproteobacteria bacterium]|nr:D-2-hydroxyacid dehydrogenase [Deltaproteobacteria bacterium]
MEIVVLDGYTENPGDLSWSGFEALGDVRVYDRTEKRKEAIVERIGKADIVITNKTPIQREVMDACPAIRYVGVLATGYDPIDVAAAKEKGVIVANVPTYGTDAVGQFTIALLLEAACHVGHHDQAVKQGRWTNCVDFCFWDSAPMELAGKTLVIIGFGRIGQTTGRIAKAMGMRILAVDAYPNDSGRAIAEYAPLDTALPEADAVALHCNLTPETREIIRAETIATMKDGVIIINSARGPLVNESDLADALNSGKVRAAAMDVVSKEPVEKDNPLLTAKNCIMTPHMAWGALECRQRIMDTAVNNLKSFLAGSPVNVVSR